MIGRLVLALAVAVALLAGIWLTGGVLTNDFVASAILMTLWLGAAGAVCLFVGLRRPSLRLPLLVPYLMVALGAAVWLGRAEFFDDKVDEDVVMAEPAAKSSEPAERPRQRNVLVGRGSFDSLEHDSAGVASLIRTGGRRHVLTLTRFRTSNGPDLRVYLVAGRVEDAGDVRDYVDLGELKGNIGDQQYPLKGRALQSRYRTVVIWCRAFSVAFARARLT